MHSLAPILTAHLFPAIEGQLIELLQSLSAEEWSRQTIAPAWTVKDVAAHLLDTHLRKLSIARDGYLHEKPAISSEQDFVRFINQLNAEGVNQYRRLSPPVLIQLMSMASAESAAFHQRLDPFAVAAFPVSWAGEATSPVWFDTARELTERWHHQQQIRLAVGKPGIMTPELYHPVLDCFMRALPYTYRDIIRPEGSVVRLTVSGACGGDWQLERGSESWKLVPPDDDRAATAAISIPEEIAWRVFTKGIEPAAATERVSVAGDRELALHVLSKVAVVG